MIATSWTEKLWVGGLVFAALTIVLAMFLGPILEVISQSSFWVIFKVASCFLLIAIVGMALTMASDCL